jgi:hypothetical protein
MTRAKKQRGWSYSTGERGRNRVRVFTRPDRHDEILLQYAARDVTGRLRQYRVALGRVRRDVAKAKADKLAADHATIGASTTPAPLTLKALFDSYDGEVSRQKGASKRGHDARCAEMFARLFGPARDPSTLTRGDWDRFIVARRRGTIRPAGANSTQRLVPPGWVEESRHDPDVLSDAGREHATQRVG